MYVSTYPSVYLCVRVNPNPIRQGRVGVAYIKQFKGRIYMYILCESTAAEAANNRQMTENECRRKAERKADHRRPRSDPHRGPQDPHRKHTDIYEAAAATTAAGA